ncbi:hypothetical protein D3C87_1765610 [compost metagenome]
MLRPKLPIAWASAFCKAEPSPSSVSGLRSRKWRMTAVRRIGDKLSRSCTSCSLKAMLDRLRPREIAIFEASSRLTMKLNSS